MILWLKHIGLNVNITLHLFVFFICGFWLDQQIQETTIKTRRIDYMVLLKDVVLIAET